MNSWFEITPRELHAKLLGPSNTSATKRHWCGGRRRDRRAWLRCPWAVAGPGRASSQRAEPHISDQAPPVWRVPEGPEGTGGLRDRPLQAAGSRVAISRAAGPDGARNTSGAARNNNPGTPKGRVPQYPPPCRLTQPLPRRGSGRMILSPGDGDASTGTCRPRRPLPGPPRRSGRRSRCAQGAGSGRCSAWWPGRRARRTRSSRP